MSLLKTAIKLTSIAIAIGLTSITIYSQDLEWVKQIGGPNVDRGQIISVSPSGNIYATGLFTGTVDFDPGPGVTLLTSNNPTDGYITKYDTEGNLIWAKQLGRGGLEETKNLKLDVDENMYVIGTLSTSIDFDLGPGTHILTSGGGGGGMYVAKYDANANLTWVKIIKKLGSSSKASGRSLDIDRDGNIYLTGSFVGSVDFDPSIEVHSFQSSGFEDAFILKLSPQGDFRWVRYLAGIDPQEGKAIIVDTNYNLHVAGSITGITYIVPGDPNLPTYVNANQYHQTFIAKLDSAGNYMWLKQQGGDGSIYTYAMSMDGEGNLITSGVFDGSMTDFDPGPDSHNLLSTGSMFVSKLDTDGNFQWAKKVGGTSGVYLSNSNATDTMGNIYLTGSFEGTVDIDPDAGIVNIVSSGSKDAFILKLNSDGNYVWCQKFGAAGGDEATGILVNKHDSVFVTGSFSNTVDFNWGVNESNLTAAEFDVFILAIGQNPCSHMALVVDSVADILCLDNGFAYLHAEGGQTPYSYIWNATPPLNDSTMIFTQKGIYELTVTDNIGCSRNSILLINGPSSTPQFDLYPYVVAETFRAGNESKIWLSLHNLSCVDTSGQLKLVVDSLLEYISATIEPDFVVDDTLIWNFSDINNESDFITQITFLTSPNADFGDIIQMPVMATPNMGDADSSNNHKEYKFVVADSYDPNDKQVYPPGDCIPKYITNDQKLTYTIRFQNTGNAEAINIHILDSLSMFLDLSTVKIMGKSHDMYTEILPNNTLNFVFNNIRLPDSLSNEPASHGYIVFEVKPMANLVFGSEIKNRVGIYFDYNPPVYTNTVLNTISYGNHLSANVDEVITHCENYSWHGSTYYQSGTYHHTAPNIFGCDSVTELHLTLIQPSSSEVTHTACNNYEFNGQNYTSSGTYIQHFTNEVGCDSIVTIALTILENNATILQTTNCENYTINGHTYNQSGIYTQNFTNINGCDSTLTLNLTINHASSSILNETSCDSYTFNSQTYNSSGTYTASFTNTEGCDSTVTLNLTIQEAETSVSQNGNMLTAQAGAISYQWINCDDYTAINDATSPTFWATSNGNYAVVITENNCSDTSACYTISTVGISENESLGSIRIFPNPSNGTVTISSSSGLTDATVRIYDLAGKVQLEKSKISGQNIRVDISSLPSAAYFIEILNNEKVGRIKLIKN